MKLFLVALCTVSVVALASGQGHSRGPPQRGQVMWNKVHYFGKTKCKICGEIYSKWRIICGFQHNPNSEEARKSEQMIRGCQSQEQATENDMREFSQQRKPSTKTGKCLHACLMESIGLVIFLLSCDFFIFWKIFDQILYLMFRLKMVCYQWKIQFVSWVKWRRETTK